MLPRVLRDQNYPPLPSILGGTNYIWLKKLIRSEIHIERINVELIMQIILKTILFLGLDTA